MRLDGMIWISEKKNYTKNRKDAIANRRDTIESKPNKNKQNVRGRKAEECFFEEAINQFEPYRNDMLWCRNEFIIRQFVASGTYAMHKCE